MRLKAVTPRSYRSFLRTLKRHDIPKKGWHKTRKQLYGQVRDGECILAIRRGELIRFGWRAQAYVYRRKPNGKLQKLVESKRVVNGKPRPCTGRGPSVSEKILALKGEKHPTAMVRCFFEELDTIVTKKQLVYLGRFMTQLKRSKSFPLRSQDVVYLYRHIMRYQDSKESYTEHREHKQTTWTWRRAKSVKKRLVRRKRKARG